MNLTDCADNELSGCCDVCAEHLAIAPALYAQRMTGASPHQLAGFFSSLVKSIKLSIKSPFNVAKALVKGGPSKALDQWKKDFRKKREYAAERSKISVPILSALSASTFGITGAIAAGISYSTKKLREEKARALAAAGDTAAILDEYKKGIGQIPGRAYGVDLLKKVFTAAIKSGEFPKGVGSNGARIYWKGLENDFLDSVDNRCTTSKKQCPPGIRTLAKEYADSGISAAQLVSAWFDGNRLVNADHQTGLAQSILMDLADASLAEANPNIPYTYGVTQAAPGARPDGTKPLIKPAPVSSPSTSQSPGLPQVVPLTQVAPADTSAAVAAMLAQMQQQGATQAQMMQAALSRLASGGANVTLPQVQQAAQQEVATAGHSSVNPWILGGLGAAALIFALARPTKGRR